MAKQILVYKRTGKGVWEDLDGSGQKHRHGSFFLPLPSPRTEREGAGRAAGVALLARRGAGRPALRESVPPRLEDRRICRSIADCTDLGRALETGTKRGFSLTPDNDVFEYLAYTYSSKNPEMKTGNFCEKSINFPDGITNGYLWYPLKGGMQDYNYIWAQCFEITLEVSCCKYPPEENLPDFWNKKRDSLISFMKQVHLGIKGQVFDVNKNPIPNVIVEAKGRNHICPFRTNKFGEYYLLLLPGSYTINVSI
ncbi:carboxypeptidase M-like [Notamacropus eugenii]|uniref:carboxypeptidase M-like n=1 Tax=Notamacropus eugenii TaxID=9315 RepID=UPI003B67BAE7